MFKRILLVSLVVLASLTLSACKTDEFTVTFDTQGGTAVEAVVVEDGMIVDMPVEPTHANATDGGVYTFVSWYTDAAGTTAYNFEDKVTSDTTVYAVWTLNAVLSFDTRTTGTVEPQLFAGGAGSATEPTDPTRVGYRFEGWFMTKRGENWLEPAAVSFPYAVSANTTLYAYWEPLDSKSVNYSDDETYTSSLDVSSFLILNPLVYAWGHEDTFINMLGTSMYAIEVDWDKAIADGVATEPGDFSKIEAKEFSVESLDYIRVLEGATRFPIDSEGEEYLTVDGLYDRDNAATFNDSEWTFHIRTDLVYEDGTPITSADFEYTLKQFLSPTLNNSRANLFFKTEDEKNGSPVLNGYEYYKDEVDWEDVGFEIIDDYSFKLTTFEDISQASAVAFANNLRLVQEEAFELSLDAGRTNSSYGTPLNPYVSYGEYLIKSWDENQKLVFNKNYGYILPGNFNYKSRVIQITANDEQKMDLFAAGDLSVAGLNGDYYAEYAENDNLYKSWDGYPQYIIINIADSLLTENAHVHNEIMYDARFRQALIWGFDRNYYATNIYAPNTASILPIPEDTKSYIQDALYYSESPQHLAVLAGLNINPETVGFVPELAISLFNAAYADWVAEAGNSGPVSINLITVNDEFSLNLVNYVESSLEALFGVDKLDIVIEAASKELDDNNTKNWNFDLKLTNVGFNSSSGAWWQYPFIATIPAELGGASFGLSMPYDDSQDDGYYGYYDKVVTVDLAATLAYLEELTVEFMTSEGLAGHLDIYNELIAIVDDPLTTEVDETKDAGLFVGTISLLSQLLLYSNDTPFDGAASEPFAGATSDSWNTIAAFELAFFEYAPLVPTVTRSSAIVYAENVVIDWPAYHGFFVWGTGRYRYLDTDSDFQ